MHFQIGGKRDVSAVDFQAKPFCAAFLSLQSPSTGTDKSNRKFLITHTLAAAKFTAKVLKFGRQQRIKFVARKAECTFREWLRSGRANCRKKGESVGRNGTSVFQPIAQAKPREGLPA